MANMTGFLKLYSLNHEVLVGGFYANKEERKMLMRVWGERFEPMGYYFVISPVVFEVAVPAPSYKRVKENKIKVVMEEKARVVFKRPKAEYGNKSPYGIADEIHK